MGRRFASFFAEFGVDSTKLQRGLTDAKARMMQFKSGLNDVALGLTGFNLNTLAGAGAVIALGRAVQQTFKDYMAYADTVRELTRVNGASAEETSRVIQFTDDLGLSLEELNTASTMAARQGITLTTDSLARMSDEFLKLQTPAEKNAYALENFGRSGLNMIKVLEAGPDKIREMSGAVEENLILTDKQVKSARDLEIQMDNLNDTWTGMTTHLTTGLIPKLVAFLGLMNRGIEIADLLNGRYPKLTAVLMDYSKNIALSSHNYEEYSEKMKRAIGVSGLMTPAFVLQSHGIDQAKRSLGWMTEQVYYAYAGSEDLNESLTNTTIKAGDYANAVNNDAVPATMHFYDTLVKLDDINPQFGNKIISALDDLKFQLAGGLPLQKMTDDIIAAFNAGKITPEQAQDMLGEAFVSSEALKVKMGEITGDEAAKNISETLNVSLADAVLLLGGIQGGLDNLPRNIDVRINYLATGERAPSLEGLRRDVTQQNNEDWNLGNARAGGGPVIAGSPYWVGEQGAEPFIPAQNGRILSREDAMAALASGSGRGVTITQNIYTQIDYEEAAARIADVVRRA